MANIGTSKNQGLLDTYATGSRFSTQAGNQTFAGNTIVGGFTATGEYAEKYAGGNGQPGAGAAIGHSNYEVFTRATEQPNLPVFYD